MRHITKLDTYWGLKVDYAYLLHDVMDKYALSMMMSTTAVNAKSFVAVSRLLTTGVAL